jgi:hypothetical protein
MKGHALRPVRRIRACSVTNPAEFADPEDLMNPAEETARDLLE